MTNQGKASIESSTAVAAVSSLQSSGNINIDSSYSTDINALSYNSHSTTSTTTMTSQLTSSILSTITTTPHFDNVDTVVVPPTSEGRNDSGQKPSRIDDDYNVVVVGMNVSPNHLNNSDIIINNNNNTMIIDESTDSSSINDVDVVNAIIGSSSSCSMIKTCRLAPRFSVYGTPFR
jgi:hypothetical protein